MATPRPERHGPGWRCRFTDAHGARHWTRVRATKAEAVQEALERRRIAPPRSPSSGLTLEEAVALGRAALAERGRTEGTKRWFEGQARIVLGAWRGDLPLRLLTAAELQAFADARLEAGAAPQTVRHHLRFLGRLQRLAARAGWPGAVTASQVVLPGDRPHTPDVFEWGEAMALVRRVRADPRGEGGAHADLIEAMLRTGMRRAEMARLRPEDVNAKLRVVQIRGKRGVRHFPLSDRVLEVLPRAIEWLRARVAEPRRRGARSPTRENPDVDSRAYELVSYTLGRWRTLLGEPRLHPHALRHSLGHELAQQGIPISTVARLLGHSPRSIRVTMHYYAPSERMLRDAVENLR